jgi:hypothetical protein
MAWTRYDVFLCYAHEDAASARLLAAALREKGYKIFYDEESIRPGEPWKVRLSEAVRASRACILCWSENARASEYVSFEYACAEASGKPVLPWLLDATPLPQMIERQGVAERDPAKAAERLLPQFGWRFVPRRVQMLIIFVVLVALGVAYRQTHQPPKPWEFSGRVLDMKTRLPIPGVQVEADTDENRTFAYTNAEGRYILHLPPPKTQYIHLVFVKQGYEAGTPVNVRTGSTWDIDMQRLR